MNLAKELSKKLNDPNLSEDYTVDDFYEEMGTPRNQRSDFATAAMLKQAGIHCAEVKKMEAVKNGLTKLINRHHTAWLG